MAKTQLDDSVDVCPLDQQTRTDELPDITFEPAHWNITTDHWVSPQHTELVSAYWHDFHADPTPIPASPGMDFSQYDTGEISYPTSGKKGKK